MEVEPAADEAERRGRPGGVNGRMKPNGFVNGRKTPPPPLPNILFSGSLTPTSPSLRRKWKSKAVEGDGSVEMLDGDEEGRLYINVCFSHFIHFLFLFLRFCYKNIELIAWIPSLAHNPPPPSKISKIPATSHQPTLVAQEHQGHKSPHPLDPPDGRGGGCDRPATQHRRFDRGRKPHAGQGMQEVDAPRAGGAEHGWYAGGELGSLVLVAFEKRRWAGTRRHFQRYCWQCLEDGPGYPNRGRSVLSEYVFALVRLTKSPCLIFFVS